MSIHPTRAQADIAIHVPGMASTDDAGDTLADVAWWLSGGVSLLAWTGIALLLTGA